MESRIRNRFLGVLMVVVLLGAGTSFGAESEAVTQAKKKVTEADSLVRRAKAEVTQEAQRIVKALEGTAPYLQASSDLKTAQAQYNSAAAKVKSALAADPAYKKAVAERTRLQTEKEKMRSDASATPEQRTQIAVDTLKAGAEVTKLEQQAMEDDGQITKAKAAMTQAQYTIDELKRGAMAQAAKDPGLTAAQQKVNSAKIQLADAEKQLADVKKSQAKVDAQRMDDEAQKAQNAVFDPTRRR